jgi:hypothetical protein
MNYREILTRIIIEYRNITSDILGKLPCRDIYLPVKVETILDLCFSTRSHIGVNTTSQIKGSSSKR